MFFVCLPEGIHQGFSLWTMGVGGSGRSRQEVARILAAGADPNEPDELGETPIFEAWGGDVADKSIMSTLD